MTGDTPDLADMRRDYATEQGLDVTDLAPAWPDQFQRWFADAVAAGLPEPNAMVLSTADTAGRPSSRTVLLKGVDARGFVFFTNFESRKGGELRANPYAALLFPWHPMMRQIAVRGTVTEVDRVETETYFAGRPRASQVAAWASPQSRVLPDRAALDERYAATERRFPAESAIPAPPHWGGLRVAPETVEFWQGRSGRLHDRLRYRRTEQGEWIIERLAP
ncbi:pyridoxine/pyridoxamine 5'-phosphate oxidase [Asanoa siamensis]|uniref:Pyridoxine/pyridoxamine 5'-phosphate oxidase n=2 Tax=Asanoa siamensis TaxID=926357 RepID=A0ABQ4CRR3_9ACTN|nr:pyridoxine/pyridoxamine 5'-phosphate oxidase [Asanoa siamensis]